MSLKDKVANLFYSKEVSRLKRENERLSKERSELLDDVARKKNVIQYLYGQAERADSRIEYLRRELRWERETRRKEEQNNA